MHSANGTFFRRHCKVDLGNRLQPSSSAKFVCTEHAAEEAARIAKVLAFDQFETSQRQVDNGEPAQGWAS
ncbi:hypothetical protein J2Z19_000587 [Ensifer adhaerens]|uniref:Uncharacterized protein n=1 Tax=Ensifer adhaerens TaxID=106592 RepID=A0ACC5SQ37_ENSAD|nr:hypothetical protein [Ensifer adhaerens]